LEEEVSLHAPEPVTEVRCTLGATLPG
jgi:hypothetical protein